MSAIAATVSGHYIRNEEVDDGTQKRMFEQIKASFKPVRDWKGVYINREDANGPQLVVVGSKFHGKGQPRSRAPNRCRQTKVPCQQTLKDCVIESDKERERIDFDGLADSSKCAMFISPLPMQRMVFSVFLRELRTKNAPPLEILSEHICPSCLEVRDEILFARCLNDVVQWVNCAHEFAFQGLDLHPNHMVLGCRQCECEHGGHAWRVALLPLNPHHMHTVEYTNEDPSIHPLLSAAHGYLKNWSSNTLQFLYHRALKGAGYTLCDPHVQDFENATTIILLLLEVLLGKEKNTQSWTCPDAWKRIVELAVDLLKTVRPTPCSSAAVTSAVAFQPTTSDWHQDHSSEASQADFVLYALHSQQVQTAWNVLGQEVQNLVNDLVGASAPDPAATSNIEQSAIRIALSRCAKRRALDDSQENARVSAYMRTGARMWLLILLYLIKPGGDNHAMGPVSDALVHVPER
jgi:hypothetical protein